MITRATKLLSGLLVLVLAGCSTTVEITGVFPTPLVQSAPLRVGIYYPQQFRLYKHTEELGEHGTWTVDMGEQNMALFRNMFGVMFEEVRELEQLPGLLEDGTIPGRLDVPEGLDGVVVPQIDKYGFLTPQISGLGFYSASIHYRLIVFDASGERILNWVVVGYGKSPATMFGRGEALGDATRLAIRDGGARIAIETFEQPSMQQWISASGEK